MNPVLSFTLLIKALVSEHLIKKPKPLYKHFFVDYPYNDGDG